MTTDRAATALVGRVDAFEVRLDRQGRTLDTVRGDLESLTTAVKTLLAEDATEAAGQPDWLACRDPQEAQDLLVGAVVWHDATLPWLDADLPPCWPWHPLAVVEVLALAQQYGYAYRSTDPSKVSDFLGRWLPGFRNRVRPLLRECDAGGHHDDATTYRVDLAQIPELARWWALDRTGQAPGLLGRAA